MTTATAETSPLAESNPLDLKPTWRGWLHTGAFPVAIALGVVLIVFAKGGLAKGTSAIFMATSLLLFGISALYHRINWRPSVKAVFRRLDHASIFLLIAGTYTPLAALSLPASKAKVLLWFVWGGALAGVGFRVFWISAPRWLYVPFYVSLGWGALMFIGDFFRANWLMMTLVLIGGAFYTAGALFYALKKPNPVPGVFGFHEIFHACTLVGFLCHWTAVFLVAIGVGS